tara:strand:- start:251 stop:400 length:150 start_codon:yes stop_codon:yes gene_type:complete
MKTVIAFILALSTTAAVAMTCSTNTISMGGKVTVCTTCCTATGCMTTCM